MAQISRQQQYCIGKESTRGTAVAPTFSLKHTGGDFDDRAVILPRTNLRGRVEKRYSHDVVEKWAEGSLGGYVLSESFGLLLLALFGSVSSAAKSGESIVYEHTFSIQQSNEHQSLTISLDDPDVGDKQYALAMLATMELLATPGQLITHNTGFIAKSEAAGSVTPPSVSDSLFRPQDFTFKHASTVSGLSGASETKLRSFAMRVNKELKRKKALGSQDPYKIFNGDVDFTFDLVKTYEDDTFRDYWKGETSRAMQISLTNSDVTIGTGSNPSLVLTFDEADIINWALEKSGGILKERITIACSFDSTEARTVQAVLTNLTASY